MREKRAVRVAVMQLDRPPASHEEALGWLEAAAARGAGADLLVFPELALSGYADAAGVARLAVAADDPVIAAARAIARSHRVGLAFGYAERADGGLYDSALLADAGGAILANYRKMHLWGEHERRLFRPGAPSPVVAFAGCRLGLLICYDLELPETALDLSLRGADVIVTLSATSAPYTIVPRAVVPARAYESGCFVVFANRGGHDGTMGFAGLSRIVAPDGAVLAATEADGAAEVAGELRPEAYRQWRAAHDFRSDRVRSATAGVGSAAKSVEAASVASPLERHS